MNARWKIYWFIHKTSLIELLSNENFLKTSVLLLRKLNYYVLPIGEDNPSISDRSVNGNCRKWTKDYYSKWL